MAYPVKISFCKRCDGKRSIETDTWAIVPCPECKEGMMTKEEINKAMAEKVMCFKKLGPGRYKNLDDGEIIFIDEFNPAERIDHAWMVLQKLNSEGGCFSVVYDDFGHWACVGDGMQPAEERFVGSTMFDIDSKDQWADTAPMAICLAALEAVKE